MPACVLSMLFRKSCRCAWGAGLLSLALLGAARADDLTELPLEQLMNTEVLSAARFARQVTDAASAVSLLTAQDIQALGLRTLGEVLDQMRGLQVSADTSYLYLGARGFGGPGAYAGRVLMLVDGVPASDNLFDQIFLGHDALIDVAMIDRIEYAPGAGSAMYGNNAFLGVINIVTRRGRDLNGLEAAVSGGRNGDGKLRLSWGQRADNGAEWLASLTLHANDGTPSSDLGKIPYEDSDAEAWQLLLKGQWQAFSLQLLSSARTVRSQYPSVPATTSQQDGGHVVSLGHDHSFDDGALAGWRSSVRAQLGGQRYNYDVDLQGYHGSIRAEGAWWSLDTQASYEGWQRQRVVLGLRLREDPKLHYDQVDSGYPDENLAMHRRSLGLSVEDELRLSEQLVATLGLRADRRTNVDWTYSPRAAMVWTPLPDWQFKGSLGRATRFASAAEESFGLSPQDHGEHVLHRELATEYRHDTLRWLATVYDYRVSEMIWPDQDITALRGHGLELEAEWQWQGLRLRASQAFQRSHNNLGNELAYSPHHISKLQLSVPLDGERWRLSAAVRRTSSYLPTWDGYTPKDLVPVPSSTRVDLTLQALKLIGPLDLTIGLRNAGNTPEHGLDPYMGTPAEMGRKVRYGWIELRGHF